MGLLHRRLLLAAFPLLAACGAAAGAPPPLATSTAEGLALADAAAAELDLDVASVDVGLAAFATDAPASARSVAAVRPLAAAWGWHGTLPSSCTAARDDGGLVLDCAHASTAGRAVRVSGIVRADATGLRFDAFTVVVRRRDGTSRTRRVDGVVTFARDASRLRASRELTVHTELVTDYGTVVADRATRSTLTFTPDDAADARARGTLVVAGEGEVRVVAPDAVSTRTSTRHTEAPLHWDRMCRDTHPTWAGFDEGVLVASSSRAFRVVFAGCGPGAATLDDAATPGAPAQGWNPVWDEPGDPDEVDDVTPVQVVTG